MEMFDSHQIENEPDDSNDRDYVEQLDSLLYDIDKIDDLEVIEDIFSKLESEVQKKTQLLKNIQKENSEIKSDLDSKKNFLSELDSKSCDIQQKTESLQELIQTQHQKLGTLKAQQTNDLIQFENDVEKISENFTNAPHDYASNNLNEVLQQLQDQLDTDLGELSNSHRALLASQQMSQLIEDDSTLIDLALNILEEDVGALNNSLEKLKATEEQLKKKTQYTSLFSERRKFLPQTNSSNI